MAKMIWNFDMELRVERSGGWMANQKVFTLWNKAPLIVQLKPLQTDENVMQNTNAEANGNAYSEKNKYLVLSIRGQWHISSNLRDSVEDD